MSAENGTTILGTGEVGAAFDGSSAVEQVFRNPLIWKVIGSYLHVGDLKVCRLVNSRFHGMVMKETNFLERSLVSLKPTQMTRNIFGSTTEPWKNVLLKFGDPGSSSKFRFHQKELKWIDPIISNVESLSLRMEKGTIGNFSPILKRLLNAPKKLRALAMEPIFLKDRTRGNFEECRDALENLEEFEVLQAPSGWQDGIEEWKKPQPWFPVCVFIGKMKKLQILKSYYPVRPLVVDFEEYDLHTPYFRFNIFLSSMLGELAKANGNTLKHVTLGGTGFFFEEQENLKETMASFSFGSLESAALCLPKCQPLRVSDYLVTLPMLKELEFSVSTALAVTILNVIGQRSDCLRKLKLQSSGFPRTNWQFLLNTRIEEFQVELLDIGDEDTLPDEALGCLPLTIRRLFVRGPLESNPIAALARLNPSLVTQLTFIDSGDCFADDTMKYIRMNFKMLRKLNVTNAERITDAGFVGSFLGSGSLSGIKGLRILILRGCGSITNASLKEIRFLELRYLDLSHNRKLTEKGYEALLSNNPSLETLLLSCKKMYSKKEQMIASHPRLSSVSYRQMKTEMKRITLALSVRAI